MRVPPEIRPVKGIVHRYERGLELIARGEY
jgi:hypothetical protein